MRRDADAVFPRGQCAAQITPEAADVGYYHIAIAPITPSSER